MFALVLVQTKSSYDQLYQFVDRKIEAGDLTLHEDD
jgi:hypothetical protein